MKKTYIIVAVVIVVGIVVYLVASSGNSNTVPTVPMATTQPSAEPAPSAPVSNAPAAPAPSSVTVSIKNFSFNPSALTVKAGTKVTWVNDDTAAHTVTSDSSNLLNSGTLSPGQSFSFTFADPGSFSYHCNIHKMMKGTIVVE